MSISLPNGSISLPNGTILAAPSSSSSQVSAAVTRILHLANFSPELRTRDIQNIFKEWENDKGGFRIKWLDDVNALIVFSDATVAKRAYLNLLLNPPANFSAPAQIRPYDKPDAQQIIQSLAARVMGHRSSMSSVEPRQPNTLNGFTMPLKAVPPPANGTAARRLHGRTNSASASSSWGRQSVSGALSFGATPRLPTHSENESRSTSSSSNGDVMVIMDPELEFDARRSEWPATVRAREFKGTSVDYSANNSRPRRDSVTADRALREVERAMASVEAA